MAWRGMNTFFEIFTTQHKFSVRNSVWPCYKKKMNLIKKLLSNIIFGQKKNFQEKKCKKKKCGWEIRRRGGEELNVSRKQFVIILMRQWKPLINEHPFLWTNFFLIFSILFSTVFFSVLHCSLINLRQDGTKEK